MTENSTGSRSSIGEVTVAVRTSCPRIQAAESWPADAPYTRRSPEAPVNAVSRREMVSPGTRRISGVKERVTFWVAPATGKAPSDRAVEARNEPTPE